jgi:uncharacterized protein YndB with AHSA1/START domain
MGAKLTQVSPPRKTSFEPSSQQIILSRRQRPRPPEPRLRERSPAQTRHVARSEATIEIDRPPTDVFAWLVEPERRLRWVVGLAASEELGGGRYRETMEAGGRRVQVESTVAHLDEPHAVDVDMKGSGVTARASTRVDDLEGGRSRVTSSLDLELGGLLRFASGVAARQAQVSLERSLAQLKALVEQTA